MFYMVVAMCVSGGGGGGLCTFLGGECLACIIVDKN